MLQDTVQEKKLLDQHWFVAVFFVSLLLILFLIDLSQGVVGLLLEPAIGSPAKSGRYGQFATAFTASTILLAFIWGVGRLSFRRQVVIVWLLLVVLFLAFFSSFNLSLEFIESKIWFMISKGVVTTLYISAVSISIAFVLAILGAVAKLSSNGFANGIANFYTSFFRGLPLLIQIYLIYLGLPQLGFVIDAVPAGIMALSLCYGAYMTEIFRAGILSIPKGQWEAARSLGFKFSLTMRKIIFPQSLSVIIPPTGNQFIAMLKDSSLVSVIGVWELMFLARTLGQKDFKHMEMLITAAMIYWALSMTLEVIQSRIERHYRQR